MGMRDVQDYHIEASLSGVVAVAVTLCAAVGFNVIETQVLKRKERTQFETHWKAKIFLK
jgi:hypothetical protein